MKARDARILLTGASGGIGQAAATTLVQAGAAVMLVSRSPARLSTQARDLALRYATTSPGVVCHAADLTQHSAIAELAEAACRWGANAIVHAAGLPSFGRFETLDCRDIRRVLETNLLAPITLTQAMLPHLRGQSTAQVIFVGSALGSIGVPGFSVYGASKFGLRGFAEALRRELGDSPIRVQYLGPRSTRTAFNDVGVEAQNRATGTAMDAPGRVADAILRMLEDEAAERFLGFPERFAVRLNGLLATLLDGAFTRHRHSLPAKVPDVTAGQGSSRPRAGHARPNLSTELHSLTRTP
jgi:short-subunit dehydrogenase